MNNNELIENESVNEEKIRLLTDYACIVKNIKLEPNQTKFGTFYNVVIDVEAVGEIKVRVDENLIRYVRTCQKLGVKPFKSKSLVKEVNEEKQKNYVCVKLVSNNDSVYRYFVARADVESLDLVYADYQLKNKKTGE